MGLAVAEAPLQIDSPQRGFRLTHETRCVPRSAHRSGNRSGSKRLRMLDLSNLWAGPLAASLLAMAGIEVLKIESPTRPDGARHGPIEFFDLMNANKAGCALDLNEAKDRAAFERLLEAADIVLESARPRALEQLGYDAATWVGDSPGRLWVSITGYGRHGPARDWIAYGDDAAVAAGLAWPPSSPPDRPAAAQSPCFCADAIADPLSGLHAAAVVLAHRRAQRGGLLDLSLVDISARAAQFEAGPLECRIERDREDAFAVSNGRRIRIAAPRARASMGVAPELRPPDEALLSRWTSNC